MPWIDNPLPRDVVRWTRTSIFSAIVFALGGANWECRRKVWRTKPGWTGATLGGSNVESTILRSLRSSKFVAL